MTALRIHAARSIRAGGVECLERAFVAGKTIAEKLQVKPGQTVWLSEPERSGAIGPLPENARLVDALAEADVAVLFVHDAASARSGLAAHRDHLGKPRAFWIAYPKNNRTDINRDSLWPIAGEFGLRPNSQVAIDETWSALRFRPLRPGEPPFTAG